MPNYKETTGAGTAYQRCYEIVVANPHPNKPGAVASPRALFREEIVGTFDGQTLFREADFCIAEFNPASIIEIYDPNTGDKTDQVATHAQLYTMLYSLYRQTAAARDAAAGIT